MEGAFWKQKLENVSIIMQFCCKSKGRSLSHKNLYYLYISTGK